MYNNDLDQLLMKKSYFAISMGFINTDAPDHSSPQQENIYSFLLKEIARKQLDSGAKIYLKHPVRSIQTLDEVFEAITEAGCCIMSFEKPVSLSEVIDSSYAVVRGYAKAIANDSDGIWDMNNMKRTLNHIEECFKPYVISSDFDTRTPTNNVIERIALEMEEKVSFGRSLSLDSKDSLICLLSQNYGVKVA